MATRKGTEGFITGQGDEGFHAPILGEDRLPEDVLQRLKEHARQAGLDPRFLER